jgi:hypothetical protein
VGQAGRWGAKKYHIHTHAVEDELHAVLGVDDELGGLLVEVGRRHGVLLQGFDLAEEEVRGEALEDVAGLAGGWKQSVEVEGEVVAGPQSAREGNPRRDQHTLSELGPGTYMP